jgi:hypothetical protein
MMQDYDNGLRASKFWCSGMDIIQQKYQPWYIYDIEIWFFFGSPRHNNKQLESVELLQKNILILYLTNLISIHIFFAFS